MCEPSPHQQVEQVEALLRQRLRGRVWDLRVVCQEGGIVLYGQAISYHAKQLGQHIAIAELQLRVLANEIEVYPTSPAPEAYGCDD